MCRPRLFPIQYNYEHQVAILQFMQEPDQTVRVKIRDSHGFISVRTIRHDRHGAHILIANDKAYMADFKMVINRKRGA